jgi:putative drug exporter of the RND superfamily
MDYHVFILSRIREGRDRGMSTEDAISHGIAGTASVMTSAAIVMVAVFGIFATLRMLEFKQMGVGLAVAILIDATIVRAVLLPAIGRWRGWLASSQSGTQNSIRKSGDAGSRHDQPAAVHAKAARRRAPGRWQRCVCRAWSQR